MTNQQNDPIFQIKKAEEETQMKIETREQELNEKLREFEESLVGKEIDFEKTLKEKGNAKLQIVKKEAGEVFKSNIATKESEKGKLISTAQSKKSEAINIVVTSLIDHVKTK